MQIAYKKIKTEDEHLKAKRQVARPKLKQAIKERMVAKGLTLKMLGEGNEGIKPRTYTRIVNEGNAINVAFSNFMKLKLGFSEAEIWELQRADNGAIDADNSVSSISKSYETVSLADLMRQHENWLEIWDKILPVYDEWKIPDPDAPWNDFGTAEKWTKIAMESPETHFMLFDGEERIVGFWAFAPVIDSVYERILTGENVNKDLSPADIDMPFFDDDCDIYFIDLFYSREHGLTQQTFLRHVLKSTQKVLVEWSAHGIFVRRISAHLSTYPAIRLCEKLGFSHKVDHKFHTMFGPDEKTPVPTKIYELRSANLVQDQRALNALFPDFPNVGTQYKRRFGEIG